MTAVHTLLKAIAVTPGQAPSSALFGGKLVMKAGEFQQTAPILAGGGRKSCIYEWLHQASPWFHHEQDTHVNFHRSQR